jgi:hypothetical protein
VYYLIPGWLFFFPVLLFSTVINMQTKDSSSQIGLPVEYHSSSNLAIDHFDSLSSRCAIENIKGG